MAPADCRRRTDSIDALAQSGVGRSVFPRRRAAGLCHSSAQSGKATIEVIPTLGGEPRVLITTRGQLNGGISPDGRQMAYFEPMPDHPSAANIRQPNVPTLRFRRAHPVRPTADGAKTCLNR